MAWFISELTICWPFALFCSHLLSLKGLACLDLRTLGAFFLPSFLENHETRPQDRADRQQHAPAPERLNCMCCIFAIIGTSESR